MKTITTKVTYSVDPLTVLEIGELAATWGVSKSEVIRQAIHAASRQRDQLAVRPLTPEEALDALQKTPRLSAEKAADWETQIRAERKGTRRG